MINLVSKFSHVIAATMVVAAMVLVGLPVGSPALAAPNGLAESLCAVAAAPGTQVIRKFCDGPAILQLSLNGKVRLIKGGQCDAMMGMKSFNAGLMTIEHTVSGGPNYIGLTLSDGSTSLAIHLDGKKYLFQTKTGSMTDKGGVFDGTGHSIGPDNSTVVVHGSFSCADH